MIFGYIWFKGKINDIENAKTDLNLSYKIDAFYFDYNVNSTNRTGYDDMIKEVRPNDTIVFYNLPSVNKLYLIAPDLLKFNKQNIKWRIHKIETDSPTITKEILNEFLLLLNEVLHFQQLDLRVKIKRQKFFKNRFKLVIDAFNSGLSLFKIHELYGTDYRTARKYIEIYNEALQEEDRLKELMKD